MDKERLFCFSFQITRTKVYQAKILRKSKNSIKSTIFKGAKKYLQAKLSIKSRLDKDLYKNKFDKSGLTIREFYKDLYDTTISNNTYVIEHFDNKCEEELWHKWLCVLFFITIVISIIYILYFLFYI